MQVALPEPLPQDLKARFPVQMLWTYAFDVDRIGDGRLAFDDGVGQVRGTWVTGRAASGTPGLLVYIMVDDMDATLAKVAAHGGVIVQPVGGDAPEITARFRDPGGNVLGLYQERKG